MTDYKDLINNLLRHYSDEYWAQQAADAMEHLINEYKYLGEFNDAVCKEYRKVKKERDAALADLSNTTSACDFCTGIHCKNNMLDSGGCQWEWRGVQEAEHEID